VDSSFEVLRGFFRIGAFIGVCGLLLALTEPVNSGEFVASVCSALMGLTLMLAVAVVVRLSRRLEDRRDHDRISGTDKDHGKQ
jgi:drug/metabolite transporter (DMT)-like permease